VCSGPSTGWSLIRDGTTRQRAEDRDGRVRRERSARVAEAGADAARPCDQCAVFRLTGSERRLTPTVGGLGGGEHGVAVRAFLGVAIAESYFTAGRQLSLIVHVRAVGAARVEISEVQRCAIRPKPRWTWREELQSSRNQRTFVAADMS